MAIRSKAAHITSTSKPFLNVRIAARSTTSSRLRLAQNPMIVR
jgi:hypothetical protein